MKDTHISPIYTFETVDPLSVRTFTAAKTHDSTASQSKLQNGINHTQEEFQLFFPFSPTPLLPNIRLIEPIEILQINPFLLSKIKASELDTVQELRICIENEGRQLKSIGRSSLDEISEKIEKHMHSHNSTVPWIEWDRVHSFFTLLEPYKYNYSPHSSTKQQIKQAISLSEFSRKKMNTLFTTFLETIFHKKIGPWISSQGGIVDEKEFVALLHSLSHPSLIVQKKVQFELEAIGRYTSEKIPFISRFLSYPFGDKKTLFCLGEKALLQCKILMQLIEREWKDIDQKKIVDATHLLKKVIDSSWHNFSPLLVERALIWNLQQKQSPFR